MLQNRPQKRGELEIACCNIPAIPKATEIQKFQVGEERTKLLFPTRCLDPT